MITKLPSSWFHKGVAIAVYEWKPVSFFSAYATIIYFLYEVERVPYFGLEGAIPIGIMGTALAIFLGFKNNSGYDRWWEARKIWGGIVNISRFWVVQTNALIASGKIYPEHINNIKEIRQELVYRHLALINALRLQLRGQRDQLETELKGFISQDEIEHLKRTKNACSQLASTQVKRVSEIVSCNFHMYRLHESIKDIIAYQGKCERIKTLLSLYIILFSQDSS